MMENNKTVHSENKIGYSKLKPYIAANAIEYGDVIKPIYEILVFEHPDKELVYPSGKHSGFPDMGAQNNVGYYYEFHSAYTAIQENICDIHETVYDAAFLICRFPGLYNPVGSDGRIYFVWDDSKGGYVEADEPEIFKHIAL